MFVNAVRQKLRQLARPSTKESYERYFKHVIKFHGLKSPAVKQVARDVLPLLQDEPILTVVGAAFGLLASEYSEEKQIAIIVLNRNVRALPDDFLWRLEPVFDRNVFDWATCDGIAGRVLRFLLTREADLRRIVEWSLVDHLWRQRASAVAFVNEARHCRYNDAIIAVCGRVVRNPERFAQLGVGWVLRELFLADRARAIKFVRSHHQYMSREGLRYATEKMPAALKQRVLAEHACATRQPG
ncbi:MAG: DNA alkylation repair protein [Planctomycetota bacterium]|nr:DNA alkylation repair protein [Planctomycetota bacterium]